MPTHTISVGLPICSLCPLHPLPIFHAYNQAMRQVSCDWAMSHRFEKLAQGGTVYKGTAQRSAVCAKLVALAVQHSRSIHSNGSRPASGLCHGRRCACCTRTKSLTGPHHTAEAHTALTRDHPLGYVTVMLCMVYTHKTLHSRV